MQSPQTATDPKIRAILEQVKATFAAKGFDGASMQDLARATGMSAGNFYRYFASKHAIIEAMIALDLAEVQDEFADIMQSPDPRARLVQVIANRISTASDNDGPLWAEIEAASSRNHDVGEIAARMQMEITQLLVKVFARIADLSETEAAERFSAHAALLVMLVKGTAMQTCHFSGQRAAHAPIGLTALVLRMTEQVLDEIQARPRVVAVAGGSRDGC